MQRMELVEQVRVQPLEQGEVVQVRVQERVHLEVHIQLLVVGWEEFNLWLIIFINRVLGLRLVQR